MSTIFNRIFQEIWHQLNDISQKIETSHDDAYPFVWHLQQQEEFPVILCNRDEI